ncbi:MAG: hypothetical protein PHP86_19785 [Nevskiales bacterium]|nr:hypothetical protein [Nevskiales bacterium]
MHQIHHPVRPTVRFAGCSVSEAPKEQERRPPLRRPARAALTRLVVCCVLALTACDSGPSDAKLAADAAEWFCGVSRACDFVDVRTEVESRAQTAEDRMEVDVSITFTRNEKELSGGKRLDLQLDRAMQRYGRSKGNPLSDFLLSSSGTSESMQVTFEFVRRGDDWLLRAATDVQPPH